MGRSVTILIVDDHNLIRDGIKSYFDGNSNFNIAGEARDGAEALNMLSEKEVDIVLSDISMPKMDGIELCKNIRENYPEVRVLALSMHNEYQHIKAMLNAGASGYLLKNCGKKEVVKAIDEVLKGNVYNSTEVSDIVMAHMMKKDSFSTSAEGRLTKEVHLTERETEILRLIAKEYTNHEIAEKLFISVRTVNAHKGNLIEKTGAKNVVGLIMYAISKNLVD